MIILVVTSISLPFQTRLQVMGGVSESNVFLNDVWSSEEAPDEGMCCCDCTSEEGVRSTGSKPN